MIKKAIIALFVFILLAFTAINIYKDGIYYGTSRSVYTDEPYYGKAKILVKNEKIINIEFFVRDSSKHEYIKQCRNDWKGIQSYPDCLL